MAIGRDFASMESLRAYSQALQDASCDHFAKVEVKEAKAYRTLSEEANTTVVRFFESFWRLGGHDIALLRGPLSHGQVTSLRYPHPPDFRN